jgi:hypothetical protein
MRTPDGSIQWGEGVSGTEIGRAVAVYGPWGCGNLYSQRCMCARRPKATAIDLACQAGESISGSSCIGLREPVMPLPCEDGWYGCPHLCWWTIAMDPAASFGDYTTDREPTATRHFLGSLSSPRLDPTPRTGNDDRRGRPPESAKLQRANVGGRESVKVQAMARWDCRSGGEIIMVLMLRSCCLHARPRPETYAKTDIDSANWTRAPTPRKG